MDADPVFSLDKPRFDQSTYYGRFLHFLHVTDPRTLLNSDKQIREAEAILEAGLR
jgi:hypothetical protein